MGKNSKGSKKKASNDNVSEDANSGSSGGILSFWNDRSPVFKFIIMFGLLIGLFYLFWATQWFHDTIVSSVTKLDAKIASVILNIFGWGTETQGDQIVSDALTLNVKTGCDGLEAMAMFSSGGNCLYRFTRT